MAKKRMCYMANLGQVAPPFSITIGWWLRVGVLNPLWCGSKFSEEQKKKKKKKKKKEI
jgi:hypothetical protein